MHCTHSRCTAHTGASNTELLVERRILLTLLTFYIIHVHLYARTHAVYKKYIPEVNI